MPDSPPQSTKNSNPRFSVGVTRVCLASGTLQIPFAMRGVFEPGSYQARDTELEERHELIFEPPRSLHGLDAIFEAHELHPNDEVILTITKEGLELEVQKRPRRKASQVKGEPWESVSGRRAEASTRTAPLPTPASDEAWDDDQPALFGAGEAARNATREAAGDPDPDDADAPRMVRARRLPPKEGRSEGAGPERPPLGRPQTRPASREGVEPEPQRASAARRFFEDPGDPDDPFSAEAQAEEAWRWERSQAEAAERRFDPSDAFVDDEPEPHTGGFFAKIAQAARGALAFRGAEREEEPPETESSRYVQAQMEPTVRPEPVRSEPRAEPRTDPRNPLRSEPHDPPRLEPRQEPRQEPRPEPSVEPQRRSPEERPPTGIRDPRAVGDPRETARDRPAPAPQPRAQDSRPRQAAEAAPRDVIVEDPHAQDLDRFAPAMLEVGEGDLRSRLVRFLQHPDVPVILRAELVARNFGLGEEVADAMLEDLTHDKIDGLAVTKVRDETYRISRAPTRL